MKVQLTPQESETHFFDALCNGLQEMQYYGLELQYSDEHYKAAKDSLKEKSGENYTICYEDVLMQILRMGKSLSLVDLEGGEDSSSITLKDVHEHSNKALNGCYKRKRRCHYSRCNYTNSFSE